MPSFRACNRIETRVSAVHDSCSPDRAAQNDSHRRRELRRVTIAWILGLASLAIAQPHPANPPAPELEPAAPLPPEVTPLEGGVAAKSYIVGPGDRLHIEMWGLTELTQNLEVTADGRLFVPRAGVFPAAGQTLEALRNAVEARLHKLYPRLETSLTLIRPRTFLVHVTGAVVRPGTYPANPMTRVSAILPRAGGTLPTGSMRRIEIHRNGETLKADLLRFQIFGQVDQDPLLLDGDTIFVPAQQLTVEVLGGVRRPGRYELIGSRTLDELFELAGGVAPQASRQFEVRISSRTSGDRFAVRSVSQKAAPNTELADGDVVRVPELAERQSLVRVEGAVVGPRNPEGVSQMRVNPNARAGDREEPVRENSLTLPFVEGDGVRDLLAKAGGLEPWADGRNSYISRRDTQGKLRQVPVDLVAISTGDTRDEPVAAGDTLVVPSRREQVMVSGAVQRPGFYPYAGDLRPTDYLNLAGGATRSGDAGGAKVLHDGVTRPLKKVRTVEPGDVITVPENRLTQGEWISLALILGNIAIGAAALGVAASR
jgi:protein involved in polysaccharide export with SLBB domain